MPAIEDPFYLFRQLAKVQANFNVFAQCFRPSNTLGITNCAVMLSGEESSHTT